MFTDGEKLSWGDEDLVHRTRDTVPHNDEEVNCRLQSLYDEQVAAAMIGIFESQRAKGVELLEAWHNTLIAYLEVSGYKHA